MGNQERGDPPRTRTERAGDVGEPGEGVDSDYVHRILQYEWADVLVARQPETGDVRWVPGHVGERWGRVAPDAWDTIRERGYDPHFRHYPTRGRFDSGDFRFELRVDPITSADESGGRLPESVTAVLRDRLADSVPPSGGSWVGAETVSSDPAVLWRAAYDFPSGDAVAYYDTVRTAIEDHGWVVSLVTDVVDEADV